MDEIRLPLHTYISHTASSTMIAIVLCLCDRIRKRVQYTIFASLLFIFFSTLARFSCNWLQGQKIQNQFDHLTTQRTFVWLIDINPTISIVKSADDEVHPSTSAFLLLPSFYYTFCQIQHFVHHVVAMENHTRPASTFLFFVVQKIHMGQGKKFTFWTENRTHCGSLLQSKKYLIGS